ncbi:glucose-1-phosphate thymidylyltransferase [Methanococcoides vulcani]|uniref:Glucose-1-phosphate thymidylyltransferase n=1 Tax=Methanococcoides vulcani TaxID=1353158 RepID=A0A1I0AQC6_9EURY|nr:sugar phosphate nucleotidyltransferase [Methanococcoides vulcani]SES96117.1 glucose-1-phosphate thymidylyltransferase [Methanococcoides vulcani]
MKVIIPAAGTGTRLFPHTHTKPKAMVYIAGKPIIGHILDRMINLEPEEIILIVGYRKEQLISYVNENYQGIFNIKYVEQANRLGLGHSIYMTREYVKDSDVMIALGDMIFKAGYLDFYKKHAGNEKCSGSIGVREVEDPRKYGIVELEKVSSCIKKLEEKPESPASNLGIAGVYFIKDTQMLFEVLEQMIKNDTRSRGEYQLTDALQKMIQLGSRLKTFEVSSWYDCGHAESLLETNQVLLNEKENISCDYESVDSVIIHPVAIGKNVKITNSVIGPHASIAEGTFVESSIISDSVIGSRTNISNVNLQSSIVGDDANVVGKHNSLNIGDSSSIEF